MGQGAEVEDVSWSGRYAESVTMQGNVGGEQGCRHRERGGWGRALNRCCYGVFAPVAHDLKTAVPALDPSAIASRLRAPCRNALSLRLSPSIRCRLAGIARQHSPRLRLVRHPSRKPGSPPVRTSPGAGEGDLDETSSRTPEDLERFGRGNDSKISASLAPNLHFVDSGHPGLRKRRSRCVVVSNTLFFGPAAVGLYIDDVPFSRCLHLRLGTCSVLSPRGCTTDRKERELRSATLPAGSST